MRYTYEKKRASGGRTSWARTVLGVDPKGGAQAFEGEYLRDGEQVELPEGTVVLEVVPEGSVKNGCQMAYLLSVRGGELKLLDGGWNWYSQFLDLCDATRDALAAAEATAVPPTDAHQLDPVAVVKRGLMVLRERDGIELPLDLVAERARNIVTALDVFGLQEALRNYIADHDLTHDESGACPCPLCRTARELLSEEAP